MTLLLETLAISACMILFSGLPLFSTAIRRYSGLFFLIGTGALTGILFLDLLPDLFEMGGTSTLWGVGIVWVVYSVFHLSHVKHHEEHHVHEVEAHLKPGLSSKEHRHSPWFFLTSMIGHCLASGVMLVASDGLTETNRAVASSFPGAINNGLHLGLVVSGINRTVFLALLAHKAYEALTVSSVLVESQGAEKSKKRVLLPIALYSLSLPVGVILTLAFRSYITQSIAVIAMSLAAGTLLGCLVHDFFIPSLAQIKSRRTDLVWIMFGFGLTQVMMRAL